MSGSPAVAGVLSAGAGPSRAIYARLLREREGVDPATLRLIRAVG